MDPEFFNKIQQALAAERLDAYGPAHDPKTLICTYLWNIAVCESLYSPLQMAEIGLRNAINRVLTAKCGDSWFDQLPLCQSQEEALTAAQIYLAKHGKNRTPHRLISELSFGFWTSFFNKEHESTGLCHSIIKNAFPRASKYDRNSKLMHMRWTQIRELRNRVFHHEKITSAPDLKQQHQCILEVIRWMSPELAELESKLDRFTPVYSSGLQPWRDKVTLFWPNQGKEFNQP